jgi:hypothetical protein
MPQNYGPKTGDAGSVTGGDGHVSLRHRVQTGSEALPDPQPICTVGSFLGGDAVRTLRYPF